ncbi:MAG: AsmA family protein [Proteobacteria bacterium]|nr:AsmA family protein [Pseudomonadota bacterium]
MKHTLLRKQSKMILVVACGVAALIVMAAIAGTLLFDINSYKPRIEAAASGATGLESVSTGKRGSPSFPLDCRQRTFMSQTMALKSFPLKNSSWDLSSFPC